MTFLMVWAWYPPKIQIFFHQKTIHISRDKNYLGMVYTWITSDSMICGWYLQIKNFIWYRMWYRCILIYKQYESHWNFAMSKIMVYIMLCENQLYEQCMTQKTYKIMYQTFLLCCCLSMLHTTLLLWVYLAGWLS